MDLWTRIRVTDRIPVTDRIQNWIGSRLIGYSPGLTDLSPLIEDWVPVHIYQIRFCPQLPSEPSIGVTNNYRERHHYNEDLSFIVRSYRDQESPMKMVWISGENAKSVRYGVELEWTSY